MKTLGQKLKEIRTELRLSVEELSQKLDITTRAYSSYERDERKPPIELLHNLYYVCNVNLNWLIANEGDKFVMPKYNDVKDVLTQKVEDVLRQYKLIK